MEDQVRSVTLDSEGLVEVGRGGGVERHERAVGPVGMAGYRPGGALIGLGEDFGREVGWKLILGADVGQPLDQRGIAIDRLFCRGGRTERDDHR